MAFSKSASAKKMFGDLPPSSSVTRFTFSAAARRIDFSNAAASGEGDLIDLGVTHNRRARAFAEAGDDVHDPRRKSNFFEPVGYFQDCERCLFCGLEHASASRGKRRGKLPGSHQQRIIPGDDLPRDSDRLSQGKTQCVIGNRIHLSLDLGGKAAIIFEARGNIVDVEFCFDDRLAAVASFQLGEARISLRIFSARRKSTRPRSCAVMLAQGPDSNARRAAFAARSTSSAVASGACAITSSVEGSMTS